MPDVESECNSSERKLYMSEKVPYMAVRCLNDNSWPVKCGVSKVFIDIQPLRLETEKTFRFGWLRENIPVTKTRPLNSRLS